MWCPYMLIPNLGPFQGREPNTVGTRRVAPPSEERPKSSKKTKFAELLSKGSDKVHRKPNTILHLLDCIRHAIVHSFSKENSLTEGDWLYVFLGHPSGGD